ncbi:MAG: aminotransferase class IV [Rubrivivax sp.]
MTDGAHLRLVITRGVERAVDQDPRFVIGPPTLVIVAEYKTSRPERKARGMTPFTSAFRTSGHDVFDLRLNSHSRLDPIHALLQAIAAGADEALRLDPRGFVASCNSTNIFVCAAASCGPAPAPRASRASPRQRVRRLARRRWHGARVRLHAGAGVRRWRPHATGRR